MANSEIQERNLHTVETGLDTARSGRMDAARPYFHDDMILIEAEGLPFGGTYRGWDGYMEVLGKLGKFWTGGRKQHSRAFIPYGDDKVIMHHTLDGHIAKNGQHVEMPVMILIGLKDGKIASIQPFLFDTKKVSDLAAK
jgi:ketosteroid isomerase-like protein